MPAHEPLFRLRNLPSTITSLTLPVKLECLSNAWRSRASLLDQTDAIDGELVGAAFWMGPKSRYPTSKSNLPKHASFIRV
jgi:hypothetical protein